VVETPLLLEALQAELKLLKARLSLLEAKDERSIEDDVQENKEDIIDLRVTDGHHDMLISQELNSISNINNTVIPSLENKIDLQLEELRSADEYMDATRPPVGSIVAWMPAYSAKAEIPSGWQRCDGAEIKSGPMSGMATPDLNGAKLFMRGGSDESAGTVEEDSVQDHEHVDPGHTHVDAGHTHIDAGHTHYQTSDAYGSFVQGASSSDIGYDDVICTRSHHENCGGYYMRMVWNTAYAGAAITTDQATIQANTAGMGGMSTGRPGGETRPKNVNVVYIMRIM